MKQALVPMPRGGDKVFSRARSAHSVSAWVIPTNEELVIARHTLRVPGAR